MEQSGTMQDGPCVEVRAPSGDTFYISLSPNQDVVIGREVLGSDLFIGRHHCAVRLIDPPRDEPLADQVRGLRVTDTDPQEHHWTAIFQGGHWSWLRNASVLLQDQQIVRLFSGSAPASADGAGTFWDLTFRDPWATVPLEASMFAWALCLGFDADRRQFFRRDGREQKELPISARTQEYQVLKYMYEDAAKAGGSVTRTHNELIKLLWPGTEATGHLKGDINKLADKLRDKIEPEPNNPVFLLTVAGGYELLTRPRPHFAPPQPPMGGPPQLQPAGSPAPGA